MFSKLFAWILARAPESSTKAGIGVLLGLVGLHLSEGTINQAVQVLMAIVALWQMVRTEVKAK